MNRYHEGGGYLGYIWAKLDAGDIYGDNKVCYFYKIKNKKYSKFIDFSGYVNLYKPFGLIFQKNSISTPNSEINLLYKKIKKQTNLIKKLEFRYRQILDKWAFNRKNKISSNRFYRIARKLYNAIKRFFRLKSKFFEIFRRG